MSGAVLELGSVAAWVAAVVAVVSATISWRSVRRAKEQVAIARQSAQAAADSAATMRRQLEVAEAALAEARGQRQESDRRDRLEAAQAVAALCTDVSLAASHLCVQLAECDFAEEAAGVSYREADGQFHRQVPLQRRLLHATELGRVVEGVDFGAKGLREALASFLSGVGRPPDDQSRQAVRDRYDEFVQAVQELEEATDEWNRRMVTEEEER